jgi:hypothetical protein
MPVQLWNSQNEEKEIEENTGAVITVRHSQRSEVYTGRRELKTSS